MAAMPLSTGAGAGLTASLAPTHRDQGLVGVLVMLPITYGANQPSMVNKVALLDSSGFPQGGSHRCHYQWQQFRQRYYQLFDLGLRFFSIGYFELL